MKLILLLSLTLFFISGEINAQTPFQFGRISASEMDLEYYRNKYPDEPAVVIGDIVSYTYENSRTSILNLKKIREIRYIILNEPGIEYGDFSIPFYDVKGRGENIRYFRAIVYNRDGRRIRRKRIRTREGFVYELGDNWFLLNFALPDVKVGSVIDISYEKQSELLFKTQMWEFQDVIPVEFSEFNITVPSFLNYNFRFRGAEMPSLVEKSTRSKSYRIGGRVEISPGKAVITPTVRIPDESKYYRYVKMNIPPFKIQPFTDNLDNYSKKLYFEITGKPYPVPESKESALEAWAEVNRPILGYENVTGYLKKCMELTDSLAKNFIGVSFNDSIEWAIAEVKKRVSWNGVESYRATNYPDVVIDNASGNSAEINLFLIALLKNLELDVYPVLLSTISNGSLQIMSPNSSQWNYVIALVKSPSGEDILIDASVPHPMSGFLPIWATNDKGLLLHDSITQWVCLEQNIEIIENSIYNLTINENGDLSGKIEILLEGYGKYTFIQMMELIGEELFWMGYNENFGGKLLNQSMEMNIDNPNPLRIRAELIIPEFAQIIGDEMILPALLFETLEENIFKDNERLYPVFFETKLNSSSVFKINYPESFTLSYLPENKAESWSSLSYNYEFQDTGEMLIIKTSDFLGKRRVETDQYHEFKSFMEQKVKDNNDSFIFSLNPYID